MEKISALQIKQALESLSGKDRLSAKAVKDMPASIGPKIVGGASGLPYQSGSATLAIGSVVTSGTAAGDLYIGTGGTLQQSETQSVAVDTTLTDYDQVVYVDASGGDTTITLPTAVGFPTAWMVIKKTDSSTNDVIIDGNGAQTIDGATTHTLDTQYESVILRSDGSNWNISAGYAEANAVTPPYTGTFNATTDWGAASGGLYTITIPAATHGLGTNVKNIVTFENDGTNSIITTTDVSSFVNANGDVSISVSETPDGRFAGSVVISGALSGGGGGGGTGTVTSVAASMVNAAASPLITITGSPITTAGTLTFTFNPNTGWTASNVTTTKTFDADSTTVNELADVLGTLIDALKSKGVLS